MSHIILLRLLYKSDAFSRQNGSFTFFSKRRHSKAKVLIRNQKVTNISQFTPQERFVIFSSFLFNITIILKLHSSWFYYSCFGTLHSLIISEKKLDLIT